MATNYEVPSWAGKPPPGLHLDISKDDGGSQKFLQKFMIDEKKCYLFGRNPELNDFRIDHASGSRVHAALITCHKALNLTFLVDLGSTHGTFLGSVRLESHKPTVVHCGSSFHFGASTRNYTLRERPKNSNASIVEALIPSDEAALPENQDDVDNLTEYNTAHNRKISTLGISSEFPTKKNKRKRVHFNEDEIVINPEDIDDSIGKFRNLVHSTVVVGAKRARMEGPSSSFSFPAAPQHEQKHILHHPIISAPNLYAGLPSTSSSSESTDLNEPYGVYSSSLLPALPNPAPEIEVTMKPIPRNLSNTEKVYNHEAMEFDLSEPTKKKYAKEAWPKKAPKNHLGDI